MSEPFFVTMLGHRQFSDFRAVEEALALRVERIMDSYESVEFYIGNDGLFDMMAASAIRHARKRSRGGIYAINLVLPYARGRLDELERAFDSVLIPSELEGVHPKRAITMRNRWMLEHSDLLIAYVTEKSGGAATALRYAEKLGIPIDNIADSQ